MYRGLRALPGISCHVRVSAYMGRYAGFTAAEKTSMGGAVNDLVRYRNLIADSARWKGIPFRADDIIINTPPKSGTTWMQTLCAMLVFDSVEFGRPLAEIRRRWKCRSTTALR